MSTPPSYDLVIIGGGLAGASAARFLFNRGFSVKLLEGSDALGGRAKALPAAGVSYDVGGGFYAESTLHRQVSPPSSGEVNPSFSYLAEQSKVSTLVGEMLGKEAILDNIALTNAYGTTTQVTALDTAMQPGVPGQVEPTVFDVGFLGFDGVPPDLEPQEAIGFLMLIRQIIAFQATWAAFTNGPAQGKFAQADPPTGNPLAMEWNVADMDAHTVASWLQAQQEVYPLFVTDRLIHVFTLSAQFTLGNSSEGVNLYWMIETVMRSGGYIFTQTRQFESLTSAEGMQAVVEQMLAPMVKRNTGLVEMEAMVSAVGPAPAGSKAPTQVTYTQHGKEVTVLADRVLVAMSPVEAARIAFTPEKPVLKEFGSGTMIKSVITYNKPSWRSAWRPFTGIVSGVNQVSFVQDVSVPETDSYALCVYVIGDPAEALLQNTLKSDYGKVDPNSDPRVTAAILEVAKANLKYFFSLPELEDNTDFTHWVWWNSRDNKDFFNLAAGAGFFKPGDFYVKRMNDTLRDPLIIDGVPRVFFCGSEYAEVGPASMEGAVRSGVDMGVAVAQMYDGSANKEAVAAARTTVTAKAHAKAGLGKVAPQSPSKKALSAANAKAGAEVAANFTQSDAVAAMFCLIEVLGGVMLEENVPQNPAEDPTTLLLQLWNDGKFPPSDRTSKAGQDYAPASVVAIAAVFGFPATDAGGEQLLIAISKAMLGGQGGDEEIAAKGSTDALKKMGVLPAKGVKRSPAKSEGRPAKRTKR